MALPAPMLVPSRLPAEASGAIADFARRARDEVASPLFGAPSVDVLRARLEPALARGASLRNRLMGELLDQGDAGSVDTWLRPLSPDALRELLQVASAWFPPERSFKLRRALELLFVSSIEPVELFGARWAAHPTPAYFVELARLAEQVARADAMAVAWLAALAGDVPRPSEAVAEAAATALLELAAEREGIAAELLWGDRSARVVPFDDAGLPGAWLEAHPGLALGLMVLIGLAMDTEGVVAVSVQVLRDPEEDASFAELCCVSTAPPGVALDRVEARAARSGWLALLSDRRGGHLALTEESAGA